MTLKKQLIQRIKKDGPMPLSEYMESCLFDRNHGFYNRQQTIGKAGSFTTAPEISQMFGELIGVWLAQMWTDQHSPNSCIIAELGPGRGTLMADIMRTASKVQGFRDAMQLMLIEKSCALKQSQQDALGAYNPVWSDNFEGFGHHPIFVVANEFFDAIPIRQFRRSGSGWREVTITLDGAHLAFGETRIIDVEQLKHRLNKTREEDIVEFRQSAGRIVEKIAKQIQKFGGAALLIDYGAEHSLGDTLQAVRNHAFCDPLQNPGFADLSSHVDFGALRNAAEPFVDTALASQGIWLERLGIAHRTAHLAQSMSGEPLRQHLAAHRRLTDPKKMGQIFKVLALFPKKANPPPGF